MIWAKTKASGGDYWTHTKCELVTWQLSGGSRSGVGGKQKLCKPHTEQERGPRTHSLTPSLSVCTFLYMPLHVLCWLTVFSNICLSSLNAVQFVLHLDLDVTLTLLSTYSKHCLQWQSILWSVWGKRTIQSAAAETAETASKHSKHQASNLFPSVALVDQKKVVAV